LMAINHKEMIFSLRKSSLFVNYLTKHGIRTFHTLIRIPDICCLFGTPENGFNVIHTCSAIICLPNLSISCIQYDPDVCHMYSLRVCHLQIYVLNLFSKFPAYKEHREIFFFQPPSRGVWALGVL
jgi:hypothetical protein